MQNVLQCTNDVERHFVLQFWAQWIVHDGALGANALRHEPCISGAKGETMKRVSLWDTSDEVNFLSGLKKWSTTTPMTRKQLLQEYLRTSEIRVNWGEVDKAEAIRHCKMLLKQEGK
jgi:hypothetical protein